MESHQIAFVVLLSTILLLVVVQQSVAIGDQLQPENELSVAFKEAYPEVYETLGGNVANRVNVGGAVYSGIILAVTLVLGGLFIGSAIYTEKLEAFNPFNY